jgi:gamma-glutamyltranspeptidase/glutathione hydrolase
LTKAYWKSKSKGYKINETDQEIVGQVDAILVLPNGKLEGGADKREDNKALGFRLFLIHSITIK